MAIKTLLGKSYKEGMTLEEVEKLLEGRNIVDSDSLPKSVKKEVFDKTASELATLKRELKEIKEKSMTDEERLQAEMQKSLDEQKRYQKELAKLRAKEVFVTAGLKEEDYGSILDTIVTEDECVTKERAGQLVSIINAQKEALEKQLKAEFIKNTPKPPTGGASAKGFLDKEIEEARASGDGVRVASLIRQQAEARRSKI